MKVYGLDENKNLVEVYDKESVLAVLKKAIDDGSLEGVVSEAGVVSKIKDLVNDKTLGIAYVTQSQYNELKQQDKLQKDVIYYITDDDSYESLVDMINHIIDGTTGVKKATNSEYANEAKQTESTDFSTPFQIDGDLEKHQGDYGYNLEGWVQLEDGQKYWGEILYTNLNGSEVVFPLGVFEYHNDKQMNWTIVDYLVATKTSASGATNTGSIGFTRFTIIPTNNKMRLELFILHNGTNVAYGTGSAEDATITFKKIR